MLAVYMKQFFDYPLSIKGVIIVDLSFDTQRDYHTLKV